MSKIYFSRSISRTMSADHPVGDPTGGAAYGEKNDPISAVLSVATMAGTYATAGTFASMTLMQGLTFAGAAMSLVGNVTGNKTLSKIGMVAGIAGGIGSIAEAKGWISTTPKLGETFGFGGTTPSAGAGTGATVGNQAAGNRAPVQNGSLADEMAAQQKVADSNVAAGAQTKGAAGMSAGGTSNQPSNAAFNQAGRVAPVDPTSARLQGYTEISNPAAAGQTGSGWKYYTNNTGNSIAIDPAGKVFQDGTQITGAGGGSFGVSDYANKAWDYTKDIVGAPLEFAKDNPYAAMALGQTAQPIADYLSGKTDAEIDALEAQTRANEANAGYADERTQQLKEEIAREKMRRQNLNVGYSSVNAGITVNPNAYATQPGLIAQQMQQV